MSDPFAFLNPIDKPKNAAPAYVPPAAPVAPLHPVGGPGFGAPTAPGMGMGMGMGMSPMGMGPSSMGMGLGMGGMPGAMGMGPGPGMGGMPGMGMGQPPQPPMQEPIMYDNIKNLLQQKPKPSGSMRDDTSMDFLENLGTGKANSVSVTSPTAAAPSPFAPNTDPFGGPAPTPAAPAPIAAPVVSLAGFEFPGESSSNSSPASTGTVSPSNGGKSSALAERLANGRRKTQEAQRQQLGFSAGAFTQSGAAPKISLKDMAPQSKTPGESPSAAGDREARAPSLEDFASGKPVFSDGDTFDVPPSGGSSSRTSSNTATNNHAKSSSHQNAPPTSSAFGSDSGSLFADSDADFDSKLNGGADSRNLSSGNLGGARTSSGGATSKPTMDFGW